MDFESWFEDYFDEMAGNIDDRLISALRDAYTQGFSDGRDYEADLNAQIAAGESL